MLNLKTLEFYTFKFSMEIRKICHHLILYEKLEIPDIPPTTPLFPYNVPPIDENTEGININAAAMNNNAIGLLICSC